MSTAKRHRARRPADNETQKCSTFPPFFLNSNMLTPRSDWLDQQAREKRRERRRLILVGLGVALVIAILVLVCIYLSGHGWYLHGEKFSIP